MATLNVSGVGQNGAFWNISGLSNPWNTTNYIQAVIATSPVSNGQSSPPSGILSTVTAPSSGSNTFTPTTFFSLTPDTHYGLFGAVQTPAANQWFQAGSSTFWTYPQSPNTLTGLAASGRDGYVHLTWNPSANATGYDISWTGGAGGSTSVGAVTSADILGLTNGTFYTFTVTPKNTSASSGLTSYGGSGSASATPNKTRPSNFAWSYAKTSGGDFNVHATEWNGLTSRINDFRAYKSVGTIGFTSAVIGNNFTASIFNESRNGISGMSPPTPPPSTHSSGEDVYADYLNGLVSALNSIT